MREKKLGSQTIALKNPPGIAAAAAVVGPKEGDGPLKSDFDFISEDAYFGEKTWEKAESAMLKQAFALACDKARLPPSSLDYIFGGDLLNQCAGSSYAMRDSDVPFFGLFGACSTMSESLSLAALMIDGGFADACAAATSSHFCSAERQFRLPLEYGGQRPLSAQWTATAAGAAIVGMGGGKVHITECCFGRVVDLGVTDINNMGAAMAPAVTDTLASHFADLGIGPDYYDVIATGDLGRIGKELLIELMRKEGYDLGKNYTDCGVEIFGPEQDTHAGGSGCACAAVTFSGYFYKKMRKGEIKKMLLIPTGALMNQTSAQQGESIPAIAHAVRIEA